MKNSTFFMVFCLAAFSSAIMVYVTGLELTILTNLLFIMIPQGYLPCAKLFVMLFCSGILISSDCIFYSTGRSTLFYTIGVIMSTSSALASFEPRDYRVVFVIQK